MRLACQARVLAHGVAVTRLLPAYADASAARDARRVGDAVTWPNGRCRRSRPRGERIDVLGRDLVAGSGASSANVIGSTHAALMTGMGVRAFTYVVILLLVGIGVEWLYWSYAYASMRAAQAAPDRRAARGAAPRPAAVLPAL